MTPVIIVFVKFFSVLYVVSISCEGFLFCCCCLMLVFVIALWVSVFHISKFVKYLVILSGLF